MARPTVVVIVPCRDEQAFIGACLESLIKQTYPDSLIEIVVADGNSTDGTITIVEQYRARDNRIRFVHNTKRSAASGLNRAISSTTAQVVIRVDAHSVVEDDFVEQSVKLLQDHPEAWCVGGPIVHVGQGAMGRAVAIAMAHPFGVGNAKHRFADYAGYAEAAATPVFWRTTLDRLGMFDEQFVRNEDDDLNLRISEYGGVTYVSPAVRYKYWVREQLGALFRQYQQYGYWKLAVVRKHRRPVSLRMFAPLLLVLATVASIASWLMELTASASVLGVPLVIYSIAMGVAVLSAARGQTFGRLVRLAGAFGAMHLGYGVGFGYALIRWCVGLSDHVPARMTALTR